MNTVTIFKELLSTSNPIYSEVMTVLNQIKTGGSLKEEIERIRTLDGDEYKAAKKKLPIICFGGQFGARNKDAIINGSGILILDYDDGTKEELNEKRKELQDKEYTLSLFSSPKANGRFKALVCIPITSSDAEYKKYFAAISKEHKGVDQSGKDIVRSSFFTYDSDIYINENATVWDKQYETPKQKKEVERYSVRNWDAVNNALRKIETAEEGYKHLARTKVGFLFGGWISGKEISYTETMKLLSDAVSKNSTDIPSAMKTLEDCVKAGMEQPLNMSEQRAVLGMEFSAPRRYKPMSEVWDEVYDFYKTGYKKGWDIGFECAKDYITILEGATSYWYSKPADGKSQIWHEILMNITTNHINKGEPFYNILLTPETGDVAQVYGELISIHARKSFIGDFQMSEEEMKKSADFVSKYFLILDYGGLSVTMKDIFVQVEAAEREFNMHFNTVTIDPLNYLDFNDGKYSRRDLAIAKDLDFMLADARKNNRHNALITHASNQQIQKNNDGQWYYPLVSSRGILDGEQFFRKGFLMVSVYRPLDIEGEPLPNKDGVPFDENNTQLWIQKAKPKGSSKKGCVNLFYDFKANRYYEKDEQGREFFAWGEPREQEVKFPPIQEEVKQVPITPVKAEKSLPINTDFDTQAGRDADDIPPF